MKTVIYGQDERVCQWVNERLNEQFKDAVGIGLEENGELIAGVVFDTYTHAGINMHIAAIPGKLWMTREYLYRCFAYPFVQLNCRRITGLVREDNEVSKKFVKHLGFEYEGLLREAYMDGTNVVVYGMLKNECRWIKGNKHE